MKSTEVKAFGAKTEKSDLEQLQEKWEENPKKYITFICVSVLI